MDTERGVEVAGNAANVVLLLYVEFCTSSTAGRDA